MKYMEIAPIDIDIDPRSFHAFTEENRHFVFDRATGTVFEADRNLVEFLAAIEEGATYYEAQRKLHNVELSEVFEWLRQLYGQGLFRYVPVDMEEQRAFVETLWHHKPRRLQLLVAQSCNLGCRYCYAWRNGSNQKNTLMNWAVAKRSIDFLVERSGKRPSLQVTFFGGEPLLNLDLIRQVVTYCEEIKHAVKKTFVYELITNATLLTPDVADFLAENRFLLMISIDGWREMHNFNRPSMRGMDEYEVIIKNAQHVNGIYKQLSLPEIKVRANLTNKFHDAAAVRKHLFELGFSKIGVSAIEPLPHTDPSPSSMSEDEVDALASAEFRSDIEALRRLEKLEPIHPTQYRRLQSCAEPLQPRNLKGITCGVNRNTAVVDTKGDIFPCHRYEGMESYVVGNVFTGMDYEKTIGYYLKVNGNATNRCHSCWIRDYCAGGCAWLLSAKDGRIVDPTERECNRRRKGMERNLYTRAELRRVVPKWFESAANRQLSEWKWEEDPEVSKECASCEECGSGCGT